MIDWEPIIRALCVIIPIVILAGIIIKFLYVIDKIPEKQIDFVIEELDTYKLFVEFGLPQGHAGGYLDHDVCNQK